MLESAGFSQERRSYIDKDLPEKQPLTDINEVVAMRLFFVCQPSPIDQDILVDCFCRFGNLIHVACLKGIFTGHCITLYINF